MIPNRAINQYLTAQYDSHNWIKAIPEKDLDEEIAKLGYKLTVPLMHHQKAVFLTGVAYPNLCFFLAMGVGKTLISLALFDYFYQKRFITGKTIIFAPTDEVVQSWENEIIKWNCKIPYVTLTGSSEEKWSKLTIDSGLVIGTYPGISWMVSELQPNKKKQANELVINRDRLTVFLSGVEAMVLDESTKCGNLHSLAYRVALQVSRRAKVRYALAGRPFGRDPILLWSQFHLVDHGETLSPTLGFFREVFFKKKRNFWAPNSFDYVFDEKKKKDLIRITSHRSITYSLEECITLPELVRIKRYVQFPVETLDYYNKIITDIIAAEGDLKVIKNAFVRMRQLSSGYLGLKDDETGERSEIVFDQNPKMDLLLDLIEEVPEDHKVIVFHEFTFSGNAISQQLKKNKIKHGWLYSGTKNWKPMEKAFNEDPNFKVLVINSKKGAFGLNLQRANYVMVYENSLSTIDRDQMEKRIHRTGQKQTCFVYDLLVKNSMDDRILDYQEQGKNLFQELIKNPALVIKNGK